MKAYLVVTGILFGVIGVAHLLRLFVEGHPLSDREFLGENLALSLICLGFAAWAGFILASSRGHPSDYPAKGP
jgi:hypothetical protein